MFAHQMKKFKEATDAVSPVVATLLLVLVAAGAAIGFSVFLGNFQDKTQKNVSSDVSGDALSIGGSTTVHPMTVAASELFEATHPGIQFELSQGGSGLGLKGVGTGALDIGARSAALTSGERESYPDLNGDGKKDYGMELVETRIGYDGVVVLTAATNCLDPTTGNNSFAFTQAEIIAIYALNGEQTPTNATAVRTGSLPTDLWINGGAGSTPATPTTVTWGELQAYLEVRDGQAAGSLGTCDSDSAFTSKAIVLYDRADKGGTSEVFCGTMLNDAKGSNGLCDAEAQVTTTTLKNIKEAEGNALLETAIAADKLGIGFSSHGTVAKNHATDLVIHGFDKTDLAFAKKLALSSSSPGYEDYVANIKDGDYDGARGLFYVTVGEPQGVAAEFIEFVLTPQNNAKLTEAIGYISLY